MKTYLVIVTALVVACACGGSNPAEFDLDAASNGQDTTPGGSDESYLKLDGQKVRFAVSGLTQPAGATAYYVGHNLGTDGFRIPSDRKATEGTEFLDVDLSGLPNGDYQLSVVRFKDNTQFWWANEEFCKGGSDTARKFCVKQPARAGVGYDEFLVGVRKSASGLAPWVQ